MATVFGQRKDMVNLLDNKGRSPLYAAASNGSLDTVKCLVKNGARLELRVGYGSEKGRTALHAAAQAGHDEIVRYLVAKGANLNARDSDGRTPLHLSVKAGDINIVRLLLTVGAEPNLADHSGFTPLRLCLSTDTKPGDRQWDMAGLLLQTEQSSGLCDERVFNALHCAAYWNNVPLLNTLLERGTSVNVQDGGGKSSLHYCFLNQDSICLGTATTLLANGGSLFLKDKQKKTPLQLLATHKKINDPEVRAFVSECLCTCARDERGRSVLHHAVISDTPEVVRLLILCDSNPNEQDDMGFAPIHFAAIGGKTEMLTFLLSMGAHADLRNNHCQTALHFACVLPRTATATTLIREGASVMVKDEIGMTPLHKAAGWGKVAMIKLLIKSGALVSDMDDDGHQAIHLAATEGKEEHVEYLLLRGAEVNCQDGEGRTPLHLACKAGSENIVRLLILHGADANALDKHGQTPLHVACFFGKNEAVFSLMNRDASVNIRDLEGRKPEDIAREYGNFDIILAIREYRQNLAQYAPEKLVTFDLVDGSMRRRPEAGEDFDDFDETKPFVIQHDSPVKSPGRLINEEYRNGNLEFTEKVAKKSNCCTIL